MIIRCAFFRGRIKPGCEAAFQDLLEGRLIPLWRQFPGAEEVRVLHHAFSDAAAPELHMVLAIRYPDLQVMEAALQSPPREATRTPTRQLLDLFDGDVFHSTFEAAEYGLEPGHSSSI
jgi:antibiotic biosynthesis monooxygenase (ABM) superfamily enzyme